MPSPGRTYTITVNDADLTKIEDFLDWAAPLVSEQSNSPSDARQRAVRVLREQLEAQRPRNRVRERAEAVKAIQGVADSYFERAEAAKDHELRRSWTNDGADVRYIAECLAANTSAMDVQAKRATASLDTCVREEIPRCAWRFVGLRALR